MVNGAVSSTVEAQWTGDIRTNSPKYTNPESVKIGVSHHVWPSVRNSIHDSRRAQLKCRLLIGTYTLISNRAVFNDLTWKLCDASPETRQHFLASVSPYKMFDAVSTRGCSRYLMLASTCVATQLILEPRHEKTCLRGLRPGQTQTSLLRNWS